MGMFDYLKIDKVHLPLKLKEFEEGWQTKSLDCYLNNVFINENGYLIITEFETKADKVDINFNSTVKFYQAINNVWHQFEARFTNGKLKELVQQSPKKDPYEEI